MPELPEVETIRRGLEPRLGGQTIVAVDVRVSKQFRGEPAMLEGRTIVGLWRRAKLLGLALEGGLTVLFHLKMTGQLIHDSSGGRFAGGHPTADLAGPMPNRSTAVIFQLQAANRGDSSTLYFNDQRKFGWIQVLPSGEDNEPGNGLLRRLGPEPLAESFTPALLLSGLRRHPVLPVKTALLDQTVVAGLGNIYAAEACYLAGIDPRRRCADISDAEGATLHEGIRAALQRALAHMATYLQGGPDALPATDYLRDHTSVYGRAGEPCARCGDAIARVPLNGRGTFFCPSCQR